MLEVTLLSCWCCFKLRIAVLSSQKAKCSKMPCQPASTNEPEQNQNHVDAEFMPCKDPWDDKNFQLRDLRLYGATHSANVSNFLLIYFNHYKMYVVNISHKCFRKYLYNKWLYFDDFVCMPITCTKDFICTACLTSLRNHNINVS